MPPELAPLTARIAVRIVPRASRETVVGMRGGALLVRVTAAPGGGGANEAPLRLVAKRLRVARGTVQIVSGLTSKVKVIEVDGLAEAEVRRRLGAAPPEMPPAE